MAKTKKDDETLRTTEAEDQEGATPFDGTPAFRTTETARETKTTKARKPAGQCNVDGCAKDGSHQGLCCGHWANRRGERTRGDG